ncbi:MAG: hypothetical protein K2J51_09795 [Alistipes sp.]|nr:hypothetical protein [Alistipes sp.]
MNNAKYTLHEVTSPALARDFLNLPKRIYKGNRNWVCPLDNDIEAVFDRSKNELFADGEAIRWVARDESGEVVGRIAAFYNRELASRSEQPTGGCGFFEALNDQALADMLFDAARMWLASRGMEAMDGPINFGPRDSWWGLLVEGYEFQPLYGNPYNPPYYKELFENYGFRNYFNQNTYLWRVNNDELNSLVLDRAKRVYSTPGYRFDHLHMDRLEEATEDFRVIYNRAWSLFTGVKPLDKEEAQRIMRTLKPIIDPEIIYFAYFNDEPIGFFVLVPDLNRIIGRFNGRLNLWNKLRLMWDLKVAHKCDRMFGMIFGIAPEFHGKGVESGIMRYMLEWYVQSGRCRYQTMEFAWIGDFNPVMNRMIETYVCASKHKMHTTYRYLFDRTKEFHRCPRMGVKRRKD